MQCVPETSESDACSHCGNMHKETERKKAQCVVAQVREIHVHTVGTCSMREAKSSHLVGTSERGKRKVLTM